MNAVARAARFRQAKSARQLEVAVRTVLGFSGALISIAGIVLTAGGLMSPFDGSAFYAVAGLGLAISGALIAKRNRAGAWTYLAVFALTVTWSLRDVDQGPSLGHRLFGPIILIAMLAALMPVLSHWRPRRAAIAFGTLALATVGLGLSSTANGPLARQTAAVTHFLDSQAKGVLQ
jgi:quinoprotein glucose dehydrogenase